MSRGRKITAVGTFAKKYGIPVRRIRKIGLDRLMSMSEDARCIILRVPSHKIRSAQ